MSSAEGARGASPAAVRHAEHARSLRRRLSIKLAAWMRWLHIYLSMFGLAVVLFFSLTGLTLNHPAWFAFLPGPGWTAEAVGKLDPSWVRGEPTPPPEGEDPDPARGVQKLEVVEHLRRSHGVRGSVSDFRADEGECSVTFTGPGYDASAVIARDTGSYTLTQTSHGFVALINDLHKGRDSGPAWSVVIDVSAVLMTVISLTGLVLLFYLKLRRRPGVVVALVGTVAAVVVYWVAVP